MARGGTWLKKFVWEGLFPFPHLVFEVSSEFYLEDIVGAVVLMAGGFVDKCVEANLCAGR